MKRTSANCPTCQTHYPDVAVDGDEFGLYRALEMEPCADPFCPKLLCRNCAQFHCDGCGNRFCLEHMTEVPDGTPKPLRLCAACAADVLVDEDPEPDPPGQVMIPGARPQLVPAIAWEDEPDCACLQTAADLFDARSCELHNPSSAYNVAQRLADGEKLERYGRAA